MFDSHAPSATRIAAARAILDATLRLRKIKGNKAEPYRYGEVLIKRIAEQRERIARDQEEERQKLLEQTQKDTQ